MIKQKIIGLASVAIAITSTLILKDATAALILLPLGGVLITSKEKITY